MLYKGGNAVDAVLATAITLTIAEPTGNGIGSDAFAILWDGSKLHVKQRRDLTGYRLSFLRSNIRYTGHGLGVEV